MSALLGTVTTQSPGLAPGLAESHPALRCVSHQGHSTRDLTGKGQAVPALSPTASGDPQQHRPRWTPPKWLMGRVSCSLPGQCDPFKKRRLLELDQQRGFISIKAFWAFLKNKMHLFLPSAVLWAGCQPLLHSGCSGATSHLHPDPKATSMRS